MCRVLGFVEAGVVEGFGVQDFGVEQSRVSGFWRVYGIMASSTMTVAVGMRLVVVFFCWLRLRAHA